MSERPLGVLVHGAGWVSTQHIAAFRNNPHARILALSSRKLESARKRAEEADLEGVAGLADLRLRRPPLDQAPHPLHQQRELAHVLGDLVDHAALLDELEVGLDRVLLARAGHTVAILEQHYNFGGMATWFKRQNGHIFDISLHGFPGGMIKTCRKYWTKEIADSIVRGRLIGDEEIALSFFTMTSV